MSELRDSAVAIVKEHGLEHSEEPYRLASGELSHDYMDGKKALAQGEHLRTVCEAILELVRETGADFDAVGGLTLGADSFAHGIALLTDKRWFVVRKQTKKHGKGQRIEGTVLGPGVRVLLVDDVVSTGGSILDAFEEVRGVGAETTLAVTLVDRGDEAAKKFADLGVQYEPLMTYRELGIAPVGVGGAAATS